MLLKVIKHEFSANGKVLWIIYAVSIGLSLLTGFLLPSAAGNAYTGALIGSLTFLSVMGIMAAALGTIISLASRFSRSMTGKEAFFTFSLPVKNYVHLLSRILVGVIFSFFAAVVLMLDFIFLFGANNLPDFFSALGSSGTAVSVLMLCFLFAFIGIAASIVSLYAAISFGSVLTKNKAGGIFLAMFIFGAANNIIMSFLTVPFVTVIDNFFTSLFDGRINVDAALWAVFGVFFVIEAIFSAVYYIICWVIYCRKLRIGGQ